MRDVRITSRTSPTSGLEGADGPFEAILAGREGGRLCVRITVGNVVWWEEKR